MTTARFEQWLGRTNSAMEAEQRQVVLLLDNASYHVSTELPYVHFQLLTPNTTAHLQQQNAGEIRALKAHISALKSQHVVERLDELLERAREFNEEEVQHESKRHFEVDVLTAMRTAGEAGESVTSETIANCWKHTAILDDKCFTLVNSVVIVINHLTKRAHFQPCTTAMAASDAAALYRD